MSKKHLIRFCALVSLVQMSTIPDEGSNTHKIFSAVFSQKPEVFAKRLALLKAITNSLEGKMKFRNIRNEIQSITGDHEYNSQKLSYDLKVMRTNKLIDKAWDGEYTITDKGTILLSVYQEIERRVDLPEKHGKTGIVGEVSGQIRKKGSGSFDAKLLGDELSRLPYFRRKFTPSKEKSCLAIKDDDDNLQSDIEVFTSGHFKVRVVLYRESSGEDFLTDFDKSDEWYQTAKGIAQTVVYYIKRTTKKIWPGSEIEVPLEPDAYPI